MYDAIIVGARAAGSPTAMLLARAGHRVLLVDRAEFPSDTLSTHYIHQPGVARLARWGLLDRVAASGCPPVRRTTLDVGPFALAAPIAPYGDVADAYAPRRTVLDTILVEAAAEAGAEVRTGFRVDARVVIGADGRNSLVARAVGAPATDARPARTCVYYTYWHGPRSEAAELYPRDGRMVITGPTNDGLEIVIAYWPTAEFAAVRGDVESAFHDAVALAPGLAERLAAGERADRFHGLHENPFWVRKPYGPGWALVGDAGYLKDPITAQGITDAFRDADLLADALDAGFRGERRLDDALADYERTRDETTRPLYELTWEFAALAPPSPEQQALFAALRDDPEQTSRFLGTVAGTVPIPEFFGAPVPA
jgi:2-polyprenyl-6-methoxyphenol hydroxylase-like FAD-dependent oxidoreductase